MTRFLCIHGHFYQPPRENPWLEAIERQDSAYPYHDWNERIAAECYGPNAFSRILDGDGYITRIINNYARVSFNFGPTLLAWLERHAADVYAAVLEADRKSRKRFGGHGSAIAQNYNHLIMPLANRRDKVTQVRWGIADFRHRFGRRPEGMWLAETAVDLESLDILAEHGIKFTILSPYQAGRVRQRGSRKWTDAAGGRIDPTTPYIQDLPSGKKITLFFYDGPISRAIAFEGLLRRGEDFADRLTGAFDERRAWPQLVHIATDGETYGHHHRHGDMALAYALHYIERQGKVTLTNYGQYAAKHKKLPYVEIIENTAWSCAHGVGRWVDDCGCNTGRADWHQRWRRPLREALDWLRDRLAPQFEESARRLLRDPWAARDDYIAVVLDRSPKCVGRFLAAHAVRELSPAERTEVLKLMELQRQALLMYTSCGWFFDEISGIETVQVLQYAGRAVQLAEELFGDEQVEGEFLSRLERAESNLPEYGNGRTVYERFARPARVGLDKVAAHYAAISLIEAGHGDEDVYCYRVDREDYHTAGAGRSRSAWGRLRVTSRLTEETAVLAFACLHFGDHNLIGGVGPADAGDAERAAFERLRTALSHADLAEAVRHLDAAFPAGGRFSLRQLFHDEQQRLLNRLLRSSLERAEAANRHVFEQFEPLIHFLNDLGTKVPSQFRSAAAIVLNGELRRALVNDSDPAQIRTILQQAHTWQAHLDDAGLAYTLRQKIDRLAEKLQGSPGETDTLARLESLVDLANRLPVELDLSHAQNLYYEMLRTLTARPSELPLAWEHYRGLAEKLKLRVTA